MIQYRADVPIPSIFRASFFFQPAVYTYAAHVPLAALLTGTPPGDLDSTTPNPRVAPPVRLASIRRGSVVEGKVVLIVFNWIGSDGSQLQ
ncbi:hypothetical protein CC79DRAFT_195264 [Sarocladium strictum]